MRSTGNRTRVARMVAQRFTHFATAATLMFSGDTKRDQWHEMG